MSLFYRYSIPGTSWSESAVNINNSTTLTGNGIIALPPVPTNVDYFLALKSNGTVISTTPVYQVPAVSSLFAIIIIFLVLVGLILAYNWRSEIGAYASSDMRGASLFVMSLIIWIIAAFSLTLPWIDIPGKASLNLLQIWDLYSLSLPTVLVLFSLLFLGLVGYAIRMWLGGLVLILDAAIAYIALASLNLPTPLLFTWGAYLYGACIAVSLLIPALIKVVRG
jgi:hypothetical protein